MYHHLWWRFLVYEWCAQVSLLMAESGVRSIAYAFPNIQIVTTAIDPEINDKFYVLPGIGNFGDRYFGTEPNDEC